ncbi:RNA-guided endonuclease InsQ/TnpB family protein [Mycolicibacterium arenosum]|uniref:Transposase n=1 Tax=Mycolicibacterium arenosum TaxID=2952157 RepID=A0ABT1M7M2_9MYCO|nr:transposase [Mycolicibacterium sp. CAU 1645]MCP9275170.1 transposase [Mycolicibacterium sp. CAU 1645]
MARHTTFRFCLDPTVEQRDVLARHAGASRFAFNQCLRMVKIALNERRIDPDTRVPWSGFDLINVFNTWKTTEDAGRLFTVDAAGAVEVAVTGLSWRRDVCQQVFEEAAVDLGAGLKAWSESRSSKRKGRRIGFPRFKKKTGTVPSFRLRNKHSKGRPPTIRVGDGDRYRSVTLPGIGQVAVHDDTRRLRRMVAKGRARVLFATISYRGGRWWCAVTVEAADLHSARQHPSRPDDPGGWVGVDRGLSAFLVAATVDGAEVARVTNAPRAVYAGLARQRRLANAMSRRRKGSRNRKEAAARLGRHHRHVAAIRQDFLHRISNELVKTHDRLVIEDLNVMGMLTNHRLARAISDAGWSEFARMLKYKQAWRGGQVIDADRWYPSTRLCPECGTVNRAMTLADRVFTCPCGHAADRDTNAAVNLARWGRTNHEILHRSPDPRAGGRATNARRRDGTDQHPRVGETSSDDAGTDVPTAPAA